jgi:type 2 lantibiotic biosynthesis protein LanM
MTVTKSDLAQIAAQASTLSERLSHRLFKVESIKVSEETIDKRLNRWCQVVAQGNWKEFQKRLQWDDLDIDIVRTALRSIYPADNQVLPTWAETLKEIIKYTASFADDQTQQTNNKFPIPIDPNNPLPFEDIWLPAIWVARQQLFTRLSLTSLLPNHLPLELLFEEAYLALEHSLLQRLVNISAKTLQLEFSLFRPLGHNLLNLMVKETKGTSNKIYYNAFLQKILQDGLLAFFQKYPVLGRLVATVINFWLEATVDFLQRLKNDLPTIQQVYHLSKTEIGKVATIQTSLSDPHHRGRFVLSVNFESGLKLIYKPKDLDLDVAYNDLLNWCNQQGAPLSFKVLKVINCQNYGWVEYVEHLPCENETAAQRFYHRAGMLLCLLYTLGGTDCHSENLIASAEHLVLVDLETLISHEVSWLDDSPDEKAAIKDYQKLWDSVLGTGLLPCWAFSKDKRIAYDISGLGSVDPQPAPHRVPRWKSVNTDDMHLGYESVTMPIDANVPILNGVSLSPNDYLDQLVEGFQQMYCFLIEQREALLAADSPLAALNAQKVRFVFRATQVYWLILLKSFDPKFFQNGVDWSIELDILSRAFLKAEEKPRDWTILRAERRAMEQLDIPYFGAYSDSDVLSQGLEQSLEKYFEQPSYQQVLTRIQQLNQADLEQQLAIIRGAFEARFAISLDAKSSSNSTNLRGDYLSNIDCLNSSELLQQAQFIAQEIQQRAISLGKGRFTWMSLGYIQNAERFQLQPLGVGFYDGVCGIVLFLVALDHLRGTTQFHDLALGALQPLREFLQISDAQSALKVAEQMGIGGTTGLGSIIYSLVKINQLQPQLDLLEDAQRAANLVTPELISMDKQFDVMAGAAGTILGLLAFYDETRESAVVEKAVTCGQHLLSHQVSVDGSYKAWKTWWQRPLTGFSHGAAGIAYALLRLYAVSQDKAYLEAAQEGIAYERSVFSSKAVNWPDFRSFAQQNTQPDFTTSWCHGAPGIGLARLGGLSILETDEITQDVEIALATTLKCSLHDLDILCCGNFGRIEVLLVASQKLSRPDLREIAQKKATWVVARAEQIGAYQLFPNLPVHVFSPSFFLGTAGIGYKLLRLAYPEAIPSVLLWE